MVSQISTRKIDRTDASIDWVLFTSMVIAILLSGCVQYYNIFILTALNVFFQLMLLKRIGFKVSKKIKMATLVLLLYLLYSVSILQSLDDILYVVFRFHDIITALLILNYVIVRRPNFEKALAAILIFFMVHGFLNWLIVNAAFGLFSGSPSIKSYQLLYVFFGMAEQYLGIHRSQGLFWEPGVYQLYLNIALHFFLFYRRRAAWAALAFVGVILTLSTTGTLIAGIQLAYFLLFNNQRKMLGKVLTITFFLPMMLLYYNLASTVVSDKLSGEKSGSFIARSFDTQTGIGVALAHPFGIGFNPDTYQAFARDNTFGIVAGLNTDRGQTNGILVLAYSTGLLWAPVILFFLYMQRIFPSHRALFFFILAGSLTTEPIFYSPFVFLFILSGMIKFYPLARNGVDAA
jgi:hypothetical protein